MRRHLKDTRVSPPYISRTRGVPLHHRNWHRSVVGPRDIMDGGWGHCLQQHFVNKYKINSWIGILSGWMISIITLIRMMTSPNIKNVLWVKQMLKLRGRTFHVEEEFSVWSTVRLWSPQITKKPCRTEAILEYNLFRKPSWWEFGAYKLAIVKGLLFNSLTKIMYLPPGSVWICSKL